jgi:hypothetical protein
MSAEEDLKKRVINILRSPACMRIQFTFAGSTVMGYGYGYVADVMEQGGIRIGIANTGGFTANYDHRDKTPIFVFSDPAMVSSPDGRATIVHEATHAVIDAVRMGRSINYGDNEVAAYIAEFIYRLNTGLPLTGPLAPLLYPAVQNIRNFAGPGVYVVHPEEVANARALILAVYAETAGAAGKTLPTETIMKGIAPPPPPGAPMVPN